MRFSVKVEGEQFKAEVTLTYDPGAANFSLQRLLNSKATRHLFLLLQYRSWTN